MAAPTYISLFSGGGGLDLALRIAEPSARCIGYCEREGPAAAILAARMGEGVLDEAPIWADVRTFPSELYRGRVAGIVGGFPCTDLSVAGRQAGITGEHSGLWFEYARLIREIQPRWVYIENVPPVLHLGNGSAVLGELAAQRFDAEWLSIRASDVGAPHRRERVFIYAWRRMADAEESRLPISGGAGGRRAAIAGSECDRIPLSPPGPEDFDAWRRIIAMRPDLAPATQPEVRGVADGMASRLHQLRAVGNGVVSLAGAVAYRILKDRAEDA